MIFAFLVGLNSGVIFLNIPPALDELMTLYAVSYTKISLLISALLWSHALMQVPAGIITDRVGLHRSLIICLVFMITGGFISAASDHLGVAVAGRVLSGFGTGLGFVAAMKLTALYAPGGRMGTYQAFFAAAFSLGCILAFLIIPPIAGLGWQWVYLTTGLTSIPLLAMVLPMDLQPQTKVTQQPMPMNQILRIRLGWVLGLYHALSYGSMINLGNWVPTLLTEVWQGSTATQFALGGALVMLVSGLARLSGGFILFRFQPLLISNGSIMALLGLFTGLFFIPTPGIVLGLALAAAWFASINFGAFFHIASRATNSESLGSFIGFINLLANLGAILFTLTFGWAKDNFGTLSSGFAVLAAICLLALLLGRPVLRKEAHED